MKDLKELPQKKWSCVFTDIDGTLTDEGRIGPKTYEALWRLSDAGVHVVPVTGRPAGWCEMIARTWPVHSVIGENGAFYFSLQGSSMNRTFLVDPNLQKSKDEKFEAIKEDVFEKVPGAAVASDQFTRMFDLAIDFAEDVGPLSDSDIQQIVECFRAHGATAKVSNIHVNGWYGSHDKLSACKAFCEAELGASFDSLVDDIAFIGDSPNDEPMFAGFKYSFAVANITEFRDQLTHLPEYVTPSKEGAGFVELVEALI
ncbi:MAG: HAD family phosphatase [Bdellovibrionales bacterium]|nr:HAD family phosphatase [Bdellovibrionales bacterium]